MAKEKKVQTFTIEEKLEQALVPEGEAGELGMGETQFYWRNRDRCNPFKKTG